MPTKAKFSRCLGYSLVELLIVVTLISILTVGIYVGSRTFTQDQTLLKSVSEIQSLIRSAQTNATAAVNCGENPSRSWSVVFNSDSESLDLFCNVTTRVKTLKLDSTTVSVVQGSNCSSSIIPSTVTFANISGQIYFSAPTNGGGQPIAGNCISNNQCVSGKCCNTLGCNPQNVCIDGGCLGRSSSITVTLQNSKNSSTKQLRINNGGAIDAL